MGHGMILSAYDLSGIQRFIFGSNELSENLGGSFLARLVLETWLIEEARQRSARVLWSGGGQAAVETPDWEVARRLAQALSLSVAEKTPGLKLHCVHLAWDGKSLAAWWTRALDELRRSKQEHLPEAVFDGAGVTAACAATGEPAIQYDAGIWRGPTSVARRRAAGEAEAALRNLIELRSTKWATDLDHLGRSRGQRSLIGVVHVDGNGMGRRLRKAIERGPEAASEFSRAVDGAGRATIKAGLEWIQESLDTIADPDAGGFELHQDHFPVRPIVYGGDDITLICDGRIALDLAWRLLKAWHCESGSTLGEPAHACAGVALASSHHPFYLTYQVAEACCRSAKIYLRRQEIEGSALDWELVSDWPAEDLQSQRERRLSTLDGERLWARPYLVVGRPPAAAPHRSWWWFRQDLVSALQATERRSQWKGLAAILRRGPELAEAHLRDLRERLDLRLPRPEGAALATGFQAGETPFLDALELADRILPWSCYKEVP